RNWSEVVAYLLDQQQAIPLVQGLRGQLPHHAPVGTLDDLVPPKLPTIGDTGLIYQVREELGVNTLSIDALNHIPCAAKDPHQLLTFPATRTNLLARDRQISVSITDQGQSEIVQ